MQSLETLTPIVEAQAEAAERAGRMTPALVAAFVERGLFKLWVPRTFGGAELDLVPSLEVFEAVSRMDGASGWAVTIGTGGGLFSAVMDPSAAHEVFDPPEAVIAGSGRPSGTAEVVDGGYRAGGRWGFASGAHYATWFTANCLVRRGGQPILDAEGAPLIRAMTFPASQAQLFDSWNVPGMRATGSVEFAVAEAFVPAARTFSVFTDTPHETGPLYRYPFVSIAEVSFAAVALGIARHAIDLFPAMAATKPMRGSGDTLMQHAESAIRLAEAEALVRSARLFFYEQAAASWAEVVAGAPLSERSAAMVKLACTHAAVSATRAVDLLYEVSGSAPLLLESAFGRTWRDIHTVRQHMALSPLGYGDAGAFLAADGAGASA